MEDKFILMGMDDKRSKHIAEVLGNKTCKKILDFLSENKEASEQDIAKSLEIPINTAEYNLKKLLEAGLVEKAKNFFWSRKGRRIEMYKLARKHIVISPRKIPSLSALKSIIPVFAIILGLILAAFLIPEHPTGQVDKELRQFGSYNELKEFLKKNSGSGYRHYGAGIMEADALPEALESGSKSATDFSTTNIQVEGVDEADIVKNDGKYIYAVSGNRIVIVDAYPAENMEIVSEIDITASEIFINNDKLIVFSGGYGEEPSKVNCVTDEEIRCGGYSTEMSIVSVYDIEDRRNPELKNRFEIEGNYVDSRMIGDYVYVVSSKYVNVNNPLPPVFIEDGAREETAVSDVYYWNYLDDSYVFTSIAAISIDDAEFSKKVFLTGYSGSIYVSEDNVYLTYQKTISYEDYLDMYVEEVILDVLPASYRSEINKILESDDSLYLKQDKIEEILEEYGGSLAGEDKSDFAGEFMESLEEFQAKISKEGERTIIHKINIDKMDIDYEGTGEVPGYVLNQFSMDEYNGYFRIATTTGNQDAGLNHLYVLDNDLEIIGKVEDLAKGERIYSARFMGERAYLVTFRQIDPFYVIDLSLPRNPEILGYLKIPGYSSYLHPYDKNHIIGMGKEDNRLKLSLFDVTDFSNPIEKDKYTVGGRYSDSNALYEHKAFLFDKGRELLVIPVYYADYDGYALREYFTGAFVFRINLDGFKLKGEVTHTQNESHGWFYTVQRSLYMDDVLYTISGGKIKASYLGDLSDINSVDIDAEIWENVLKTNKI